MIRPYLKFNREAAKAFELYKTAFDGEIIKIQKYGDMPANPNFPILKEDKELILHLEMKLTGSGIIMGSDTRNNLTGEGKVSISVEFDSEIEAQKAWNTLKEDAKVGMELQQTFFAKQHGSLRDKFGVDWVFTVR
ncbi:VOC family protein [Aciduricibacillus chroicocephali]|uniref:VOC family protein n=1 Tax=Aciduricibacillus chroicocephali TaxID=3054939 RepID=A0ABY9KVZ6_9BACI|nr:VOC family protein [Bacillaceae bacterium 44XB]